jgi:ComF family protein
VRIGDRHGEARAAEEVAGGADVNLRVNMRRSSAVRSAIPGKHRFAKPWEAARPGEGSEKQAIRAKRPANQCQCPWQIVDAVQPASRDHQIETLRCEWQEVLVALDPPVSARGLITRVGADRPGPTRSQPLGNKLPCRTENKRVGKAAGHKVETVDQLIGQHPVELVGLASHARSAVTAQTPNAPVEGGVMLHGRLVPGRGVGDKRSMRSTFLARRSASILLDFALPPRCPGCGQIVADMHQFCLACWQSIDWLGGPCCNRCGTPFPFEQGAEAECAGCIANPPRCQRICAAVAYGEIARKVVLKLKYGGKAGVARTMAKYMERQLAGLGDDAVLVPVPLHRWRIWRRGYNQSALLAQALAQPGTASLLLDGLERRRRTPPLRGMSRLQRRRTVRGAFEVPDHRKRAIAGRNVILVDDVYTSGATANACALALEKAGAASVNLLCWARVVGVDDSEQGGGGTGAFARS